MEAHLDVFVMEYHIYLVMYVAMVTSRYVVIMDHSDRFIHVPLEKYVQKILREHQAEIIIQVVRESLIPIRLMEVITISLLARRRKRHSRIMHNTDVNTI